MNTTHIYKYEPYPFRFFTTTTPPQPNGYCPIVKLYDLSISKAASLQYQPLLRDWLYIQQLPLIYVKYAVIEIFPISSVLRVVLIPHPSNQKIINSLKYSQLLP